MHLLAISRSPRYSKSDADAAILLAVVRCLRQRGHQVDVMSEQEYQQGGEVVADTIFGMYREDKTLRMLDKVQREGIRVIPTPDAVRNARRERHIPLLMQAGIPMPAIGKVGFPCWLKKAQGWTETPDDLIFCQSHYPREVVLSDYIVQQHLEGDQVKFYGVEGTGFFHCQHTTSARYPFNRQHLCEIAAQASRTLSLPIYGGDAIITPQGDIRIIDFNDWPSFSLCSNDAAVAITHSILQNLAYGLQVTD